MLVFTIKGDFFILMKLVLEVSLLILLSVCSQVADVTFEIHLVLSILLVSEVELTLLLTSLLSEVLLVLLQPLCLLLDNLELSIKDEFLAFDLKALFSQVL